MKIMTTVKPTPRLVIHFKEASNIAWSLRIQLWKLVIDQSDAILQGVEVEVLRVHHGDDRADDTGHANRHDVTGQHRVATTQSVQINGTVLAVSISFEGGADNPGNHRADLADDGTGDGASRRGVLPGQHKGNRHDCGADEDTHHQIDKAQRQAQFKEDDGQDAHEQTEAQDCNSGNLQDLLTSRLRVDVLLVDVVRNQGRDGDLFRGTGGSDGHKQHNGDHHGTTLTEEVNGGGRRDQTVAGFARGDR